MSALVSIWSNRNYRIALLVTLLALAWLFSGVLLPEEDSESANSADKAGVVPEAAMRVQARRIEAQSYATRVLVNGHTEANRSVRLRAELDGVIARLPVPEGSQVQQGEVICEIEAEDRLEKLALAEAALNKARLDYAGAERLKKKGLQSDTAMAQQNVALAQAQADFTSAKVMVDNLKIRAPFAGVVNKRAVELGDFIRRGEECATLLDLDPILVVGEVSENQVGNLVPAGPASAELQRGIPVQGNLRYISQQAQEITRAYRVEVAVNNPGNLLRGGLSGRLALPTGEILAHHINSSLLTLDDSGTLGVRVLNENNQVDFINVTLVGDGDGGVWVSGLPDPVTLITVGQEYVSQGDIVKVEMSPPEPALSVQPQPVDITPEPVSVPSAQDDQEGN
ncbi:efflux RND transporter periplasmic adaptor subunit [Microbulbifer variabilis]|uniref:Efflux RND transporter periplasmic adaptor subunit n=1 Tax=Microbulbifer variabilis TaxID=266805 RepID=A0ABY4VD29_9GAMM|nr:efflux RND transporter periplasmic adaptor subunit [Microbulbifer variabilis]USD22189.1 efflux RND transporter periplasmic adaptor subunit [Microbulbifer variabilis]